MSSPFDQSRYQVRLEWGAAGLARLAPSDIVVVVDVWPGADTIAVGGAQLLRGDFTTASQTAAAVLDAQRARGERTSVALIAAGDDGRCTVEDHLAAGAIVDALGALGLDHTSPEAAAAGEAFRGLRGALRHLLAASGSGQALIAAGRRDEVLAAAVLG